MKKRIFTLALALMMCLTLLPAHASASNSSIRVVAMRTEIKADSLFNSEGYGSLTMYEPGTFKPLYALIDNSGNYVSPYGVFPNQIDLYDGVFVSGFMDEVNYSLFDLATGGRVISSAYDYLTYYNGYGHTITRTYTDPNSPWSYQDEQTLIDRSGNIILTLPALFNLQTSAGGGAYEFEYRTWGSSYGARLGGYSDGLIGFYSTNPVSSSIFELTISDYETARNAAITDGRTSGYMDLQGNIIISQQFSEVYPFFEGLAAVAGGEMTGIFDFGCDEPQGKFGYISKTGEVVIDFVYRTGSSFSGGYAYVSNDAGKYGYIDKTGSVIIPLSYDMAFGAGDGILFSVGNIVGSTTDTWGNEIEAYKYGLVDANGVVVIPLEYDDISTFKNGVAYAIKDGTVYVISHDTDKPSSWALDQVNAAIATGLVPETLQSQYTAATTRAEFCALAVALYETAMGREITERSTFSDTSDINVQKMAALGVVTGVGDNKFSPNSALTREQAATMLARLADVMFKPLPSYSATFADVNDISLWASVAVGQVQAAGIMSGVGDNKFSPFTDYTREQSIITIMRLYDFMK